MRIVLLSILIFEVIVFGLAIPVMILISDVPPRSGRGLGGGAALLALVAAGLMRRPAGLSARLGRPAGRAGARLADHHDVHRRRHVPRPVGADRSCWASGWTRRSPRQG